ncbi:hypothetical protein [Streptomyces sp. NPDC091209]|uniref:hypothetical protein n=1 Tax=Streptomyces sp. NPDC091209 TaxID=3365974 RepID=UPI003819BEB4
MTDAVSDLVEQVLSDRGWCGAGLEAPAGRKVLRILREAEHRAPEPLWPTAPLR